MGCFSNRYTYGGMVASEVANKITESAIPVLWLNTRVNTSVSEIIGLK